MPETSLYRRHRPQSFDELVGQEHVVRTLRNAVERDRVHHAYLFVGSRGTGKTSVAKILARSLNCDRGPTPTPCGECNPCRAIAAGTSLDVIEMDAASNRSVDDIRELRERVGYAPAEGRWKVYILDEAHMLTREAWNAFLKTLEEPPPSTVFVLATTEPHKVMPTIVDRCQRFDFQRPSLEQIVAVLRRVVAAEGIEIEDGAIGAIARSATGSFRDALATLDQLRSYGGAEIATEDVLAVLGVADAELIFAAAEAIVTEDGRAALEATEDLARSGRDAAQFARDLIAHLRQLLVVRTTGEIPDSFTVTAAHADRLREQAAAASDLALIRAVDELSAAVAAIRDGDEARMTLELALLKASRPELHPSVRALAQRLERLEGAVREGGGREAMAVPRNRPAPEPAADREPAERAATGAAARTDPAQDSPEGSPRSGASAGEAREADDPAPPDPAEPASSEDPPRAVAAPEGNGEGLDVERVAGLWPAVVDRLDESGSGLLSTVFGAARPVAVDPERAVLRVGFPAEAAFNKRKAERQANRDRLAEALATVVGERLRPEYVLLDADPEAEAEAANGEGAERSPEEWIERLKAEFDAEEWEGDGAGGETPTETEEA